TAQIGGQYESQQESFRSLMVVTAIAMLLVLGLLVAQFRRFTAALVIMSAAPLSLVGAFGLLVLTGTPLNVSSFMGLILLIALIGGLSVSTIVTLVFVPTLLSLLHARDRNSEVKT